MDDLPQLDEGPERAARVSGCLFSVLGAGLMAGGAVAPGLVGEIVLLMAILAVLAFGLGVAMLLLGAQPTVLLAAVVTGLTSLGLWSLFLVRELATTPAADVTVFALPALLSAAATIAAVTALALRAR